MGKLALKAAKGAAVGIAGLIGWEAGERIFR